LIGFIAADESVFAGAVAGVEGAPLQAAKNTTRAIAEFNFMVIYIIF
jgi:hypothetical protein